MSVCSDKTDEEIPFDPPIVSKFGPISRSCKTKFKSSDPVQATANQVNYSTYLFVYLYGVLESCSDLLNYLLESARKSSSLLTAMCIGFLTNHCLCKTPQNQLVRVFLCFFSTSLKLFHHTNLFL